MVRNITTEPLDPSRPVLARGQAAASEEDIYRDNPQIARLFASRFEVAIVGFESEEGIRQTLPALPPKVHSFVYSCAADEVARFTENLDFLRHLASYEPSGADQVIAACVREASRCRPEGQDFLLRAGRVIAAELAGDLPRLSSIMRMVTS